MKDTCYEAGACLSEIQRHTYNTTAGERNRGCRVCMVEKPMSPCPPSQHGMNIIAGS